MLTCDLTWTEKNLLGPSSGSSCFKTLSVRCFMIKASPVTSHLHFVSIRIGAFEKWMTNFLTSITLNTTFTVSNFMIRTSTSKTSLPYITIFSQVFLWPTFVACAGLPFIGDREDRTSKSEGATQGFDILHTEKPAPIFNLWIFSVVASFTREYITPLGQSEHNHWIIYQRMTMACQWRQSDKSFTFVLTSYIPLFRSSSRNLTKAASSMKVSSSAVLTR